MTQLRAVLERPPGRLRLYKSNKVQRGRRSLNVLFQEERWPAPGSLGRQPFEADRGADVAPQQKQVDVGFYDGIQVQRIALARRLGHSPAQVDGDLGDRPAEYVTLAFQVRCCRYVKKNLTALSIQLCLRIGISAACFSR